MPRTSAPPVAVSVTGVSTLVWAADNGRRSTWIRNVGPDAVLLSLGLEADHATATPWPLLPGEQVRLDSQMALYASGNGTIYLWEGLELATGTLLIPELAWASLAEQGKDRANDSTAYSPIFGGGPISYVASVAAADVTNGAAMPVPERLAGSPWPEWQLKYNFTAGVETATAILHCYDPESRTWSATVALPLVGVAGITEQYGQILRFTAPVPCSAVGIQMTLGDPTTRLSVQLRGVADARII